MTAFEITPAGARAALGGLLGSGPLDDDAVVRRHALVVWNTLAEPGDSTAGELIAELGPEDALREAARGGREGATRAPRSIGGAEFARAVARWRPRMDDTVVAASIAAARRHRVRLLVAGDPEWPAQLNDLGPHAPLCLWVRGEPGALARLNPSVAIVGARAATGYGEHVAMELAAELAGRGIPIVSGAAYGIDGMAHRAALSAGGLTVALLAGGVERPYPSGHADLIDRIAQSGAVVSEVPCGSSPTKWRFLMRNRLIAALGSATVVVEAGWRSGSLNTAGHAAALSRPLGAVPGPVTSAASAGCHRLLREFDAQCVTGAEDVRELLGLEPQWRPHPSDLDAESGGHPRTDDRARIRDALSTRTWRDAEDLARRSGMAHAEVEALLGLLQLEGEIERGPVGWRLSL